MTRALVQHGLSQAELAPLGCRTAGHKRHGLGQQVSPNRCALCGDLRPSAQVRRFAVIFFLLSNARSSAVSPAVFMLAQERDLKKKTLKATLTLPISWNTLVLGKAVCRVADGTAFRFWSIQ